MKYYFTVSYPLIDSISTDLEKLKNKFPNEVIYVSDKPITSIYVKDIPQFKDYGKKDSN